MTTNDKLMDFIKTFRNAWKIAMAGGRRLSAEDMANLSSVKRHLEEMDITKADVFVKELKWDCESDKLFIDKKQAVVDECKRFTELYRANKEHFDNQCSSKNIAELLFEKAKNEFFFQQEEVSKEIDKWEKIFKKYNDITRIYNSMDCRPGQENEDMKIIDGYREELYDMVGHPIYLDKVNEEHDEAYKTWNQKINEKEEIRSNIQKRYSELNRDVDSNVLSRINLYSEVLMSAFLKIDGSASALENEESPVSNSQTSEAVRICDTSTHKKRGGQQITRYSNLRDCVTSDTYNKIHEAVKSYIENGHDYRITCTFVKNLFEILKIRNGLECAVNHFGDLFKADFPELCSFEKGKNVYNGRWSPEIQDFLNSFFPKDKQQDSKS